MTNTSKEGIDVTDRNLTDPDTNGQIRIVEMTPEWARQLLKQNRRNRNVRQPTVKRYCSDMEAGRWMLTGAVIVVGRDGRLLDGQHRLLACVQADVPFPTALYERADESTQLNIDTGIARSFADTLKWRGEKNVIKLSSAIRMGIRWTNDGLIDRTTARQVSTASFLDWFDANPGIRDHLSCEFKELGYRGAPTSVAHYRMSQVCPAETAKLWEMIKVGANLSEGHPALAYRSRILSAQRQPHVEVHPITHLAYLVKTWNFYVQGKRTQLLVWRPGGLAKESFPQLLDLDGFPADF